MGTRGIIGMVLFAVIIIVNQFIYTLPVPVAILLALLAGLLVLTDSAKGGGR
ncbi:MAG: hypothetical protein IJH87_04450 [Atopobiaceae bacterium]|nr:hypothetical protein [Atopobiaceae bacterium]